MFGNYINGEWITSGATFENRNPANTGEVVGTFVKGSAADIDAAAAAATAAFPGWSSTSGPARGNILYKAADILDKNFESVAADMTREEGKTLPEAKGEVRRAINIFRYFAGEGSRLPGMLVPSERDRVHMFALRKPVGVVGLITPWNFPSAIPAWKLAPALDLRQHGGDQACVRRAAERMAHCGSAASGGHSEGRGELRGWVWRRIGRSAGECRRTEGGFVHGLLRDRRLAARRGQQAPPAHPARNGRQESDHRAGRCRFQ